MLVHWPVLCAPLVRQARLQVPLAQHLVLRVQQAHSRVWLDKVHVHRALSAKRM